MHFQVIPVQTKCDWLSGLSSPSSIAQSTYRSLNHHWPLVTLKRVAWLIPSLFIYSPRSSAYSQVVTLRINYSHPNLPVGLKQLNDSYKRSPTLKLLYMILFQEFFYEFLSLDFRF